MIKMKNEKEKEYPLVFIDVGLGDSGPSVLECFLKMPLQLIINKQILLFCFYYYHG